MMNKQLIQNLVMLPANTVGPLVILSLFVLLMKSPWKTDATEWYVRFPQVKAVGMLSYCIWQRDDSPEAFYSCSDVVFNNDTNTNWREIGQVRAQQD